MVFAVILVTKGGHPTANCHKLASNFHVCCLPSSWSRKVVIPWATVTNLHQTVMDGVCRHPGHETVLLRAYSTVRKWMHHRYSLACCRRGSPKLCVLFCIDVGTRLLKVSARGMCF